MAGTMVEIPSNGHTVPAYLSLPASGHGAGVVVIQEWWGLVPHIKSVVDRLAAEGFVAIAPDLYHGKETREPDEAGKLAMSLEIDRATRDMSGAVSYLLQHDSVRGETVGVVGFCMGGGLALTLAAARPEVGAAVSFYGAPQGLDAGAIKGAVLAHFAEHDHFVTPAVSQQLGDQLKGAGIDTTTYHYPGTDHAFFNDARPEVYSPEAAATAWQRTLAFLRERLPIA